MKCFIYTYTQIKEENCTTKDIQMFRVIYHVEHVNELGGEYPGIARPETKARQLR